MRGNEVDAAAEPGALTVFDDHGQQVLSDALSGQQAWTGILGKLLAHLLEQGTASYDDLIEVQVIYGQLSQGATRALEIVTAFTPFRDPIDIKVTHSHGRLTLDHPLLASQAHPLAQD